MGFMDSIRDGANWLVGGLTSYGQEGLALRGRLADMSEKPYAAAALAKIDELSESGLTEAEQAEVIQTYMRGLSSHMATLPDTATRFNEFKEGINAISGGSSALAAFDAAPAGVQEALINAVTYNPNFLSHVTQNPQSPVGNLLSPEVLRDPQYAGPISDILNSIANDPNYDMNKLDAVGTAAANFFAEANKPEAERNAERIAQRQRELLNAVRDAGGNIPALANLNGEMMLQFLNDLFNGDLNMAIGNLAGGLGLQGADLQDFQELMRPLAGIMQFMGQDYYDFGAHYGPQMFAGASNAWNTVDRLMNGSRVEFNGNIAATAPAGAAGAGELESVADAGDAIPAGGEVIHTASLGYDMTYPELRYSAQATVGGRGLDDVAKLTDGNANAVIAGEENPGYADGTLVAAADLGRTKTFESNGLNMG